VILANYGTSNDAYLQRVLEEYRKMPYAVDIVVLSNIPKSLGSDVEVVVGLPGKDPHTLPFGHKRIFAERTGEYELFVYSEDDILITERNIETFLEISRILPDDEIAGFVRAETDPTGTLYYDPPHAHFHWDPDSVRSRGEQTFAFYTNEHSACFILTQQQLRRAIQSGGFLVQPHTGKYDFECSASTDPYTQCGFRKLICLSRLDDFTVRHLPAYKYKTRPYRHQAEFQRQIDALLEIEKNGRPRNLLFDPETKILHTKWSKDYYEPIRSEILSQLPAGVRSVLSIGCGWGASEGHLVQKGLRVVGVPMDSVIAACAEAKGVEIVYGDFQTAREKLANESFDCVLLSNVLHLVRDPAAVLSTFADLLSPQGVVIASAPNLGRMPIWLGRLRGKPQYRGLGSYEKTGLHLTSARLVRKWFKQCRLKVESIKYMIPPRAEAPHRLLGGLADPLIGNELIARGRKI